MYHVRIVVSYWSSMWDIVNSTNFLILTLQDLGNTNFSIHLPRASFDRHATAQVVLRAVRSLGVDAHVNERNDICVGKEKMSANHDQRYGGGN